LHKFFEFIYVEEGEVTLSVEGVPFAVAAGFGGLVLPNQVHAYDTPARSVCKICLFPNHYVYDYFEKTKDISAENPVFPFDSPNVLFTLKNERTNIYLQKSCLYKIISDFDANLKSLPRNNKSAELAEKIINYIENNFADEISLKNIARDFGYDYHYLSGIISGIFHTNFSGLLNSYRINYAKRLLKNSALTITEISRMCGYNSIRSFNHNFLSLTNTPPRVYRRLF
jgi:AraC-like DNA-binding protein